MRSDFRSISCFSGVMVYPGLALWWESLVLMMPSNLGFCCSCSYACFLSSGYLKCLLLSIYLIGACCSYNSGWFRSPQSSAFSVILWFRVPVNLRSGCFRVLGSQVFSETLRSCCDQAPGILVSWNPKILCLLYIAPRSGASSRDSGAGVFETKVYQHWSEGTRAAGQAGLLCPCSCCHTPIMIGLEQMLCSTHQWS